MNKKIDKHIKRLDNDIETTLNLIKDTCDSNDIKKLERKLE